MSHRTKEDTERLARIVAERERQDAAGEDLRRRLVSAIDVLPLDDVRALAQLLLEELGYLGEHMPAGRESVAPFACSENTYHYCSFMAQHDPGCPAIGGDGALKNGYESARPCAADCGEIEAEPWCQACGFDCPTCDLVDSLLGLLARTEIST